MNDKKKTLVIAGIAVVLVGIGAFQFIPKGGAAPKSEPAKSPTTQTGGAGVKEGTASDTAKAGSGSKDSTDGSKSKDGEKEVDPQKAMLLAMVKDPLPKRDPFQQQMQIPGQEADPNAYMPPSEGPKSTKPAPERSAMRRGYGGPGITGDVAPIDPLPNGMEKGANGPVALQGGAPLRQPGEFAYQVKGVIVGKKPMAVFEDDNGNQRLVPLGGSIDGDSTVTGVEKGKVRIRHKGKDKTLTLSEGH